MRYLMPLDWSHRRLSRDFYSDFDRLIDGFLQPSETGENWSFTPSCDIDETKDHYVVSFDLPGVRSEDINIDVKDNVLTVGGERRREMNSDEGHLRRYERSYGEFRRSFKLPDVVEADSIEANYQDGVLHILMPKTQKAQGRKIEVQSKKQGFFDRLLNKGENKEVKSVN